MKIKFEMPLNIYKPTIHENQLISADLPDILVIAASVPEPESQSGQVSVRLPGQVLFIHISRSEITFGTFYAHKTVGSNIWYFYAHKSIGGNIWYPLCR